MKLNTHASFCTVNGMLLWLFEEDAFVIIQSRSLLLSLNSQLIFYAEHLEILHDQGLDKLFPYH